jgi:solute carrier family 35, member E1
MPHSTSSGSYSREPSVSRATSKSGADTRDGDSGLEKFPDHIDAPMFASDGWRESSPSRGFTNGVHGSNTPAVGRWQPRRESLQARGVRWGQMGSGLPLRHGSGHGRQKSITEAFRTIRERNGSVSQNAHEIAGALKAPLSWQLIVCHPALGIPYIANSRADNVGFVDTMCHVVHVLRLNEHILQVHLECF